MLPQNSTTYIRHKWTNIIAGEMIWFLGIMLRTSLEPIKMGGYFTYFVNDADVHPRSNYLVDLHGYHVWAKEVMILVHFKKIRSAFHPEAGESQCHDKCHRLRYIIQMFNYIAKKIFYLLP